MRRIGNKEIEVNEEVYAVLVTMDGLSPSNNLTLTGTTALKLQGVDCSAGDIDILIHKPTVLQLAFANKIAVTSQKEDSDREYNSLGYDPNGINFIKTDSEVKEGDIDIFFISSKKEKLIIPLWVKKIDKCFEAKAFMGRTKDLKFFQKLGIELTFKIK